MDIVFDTIAEGLNWNLIISAISAKFGFSTVDAYLCASSTRSARFSGRLTIYKVVKLRNLERFTGNTVRLKNTVRVKPTKRRSALVCVETASPKGNFGLEGLCIHRRIAEDPPKL